jgi:hypothetical protein
MSGFFRKSILQHRIALETVWPLAFPRHSFCDLRLIRSPLDQADSYWEGEDWKRAARAYHQERKQSRSKGDA